MENNNNNYIHDDIVFSILSKLPLKSMKRFECVSKSWSLLFENPHFMNMVRTNFLSKDPSCCHDASLLLHRCLPKTFIHPCLRNTLKSELYSLSGERCENMVKLHIPNPCQKDGETLVRFDIINLGSISDFIFAYCPLRHNNIDTRVALWNLTTQEFKLIPKHGSQPCAVNASNDVINFYSNGNLHGFGYDRVTNDYKVINHVTFLAPPSFSRRGYVALGDTSLEPLWEIYSLRSNSWRKLDVVMPASYGSIEKTRVYLNGVCHWWCIDHYFESDCKSKFKSKSYLVSFDLSNETFCTTPIPTDVYEDDYCSWGHLAVLNASVALLTYHTHMTTFNISILGELSVKESWTKLFINVGPFPCIEFPFGFGKGKIFFITKDEEVAWFDLSTRMIKEVGVKGEVHTSRIVVYKENLPIGGIN